MKITIKNLQQETFLIEIEPTETVLQLKTAIETQCGDEYPAKDQKLIYAGKILADEQLLSTYNIDEKKFIVVMVMRSKAMEGATSATVSTATTTASTPTTSTTTTVRRPVTIDPDYKITDSFVEGEQYDLMVNKIVAMGYDRTQVEQALVASFSNPERAIEYLVHGIPESSLELLAGWGTDVGNPLAFLRSQPQFLQMRAAIRQNPELLNNILQEIGERNPRLLNLINQHRESFLDMLNERDNVPVADQQSQQLTSSQSQGQVSQPQTADVSQDVMNISQEDKRAIENLKALGFSEQMVIEAYFACDKNENLAANFLLSQIFDD